MVLLDLTHQLCVWFQYRPEEPLSSLISQTRSLSETEKKHSEMWKILGNVSDELQ